MDSVFLVVRSQDSWHRQLTECLFLRPYIHGWIEFANMTWLYLSRYLSGSPRSHRQVQRSVHGNYAEVPARKYDPLARYAIHRCGLGLWIIQGESMLPPLVPRLTMFLIHIFKSYCPYFS